jgi:hypothetical protein
VLFVKLFKLINKEILMLQNGYAKPSLLWFTSLAVIIVYILYLEKILKTPFG